MIQRIQTVWILLAAVLVFLTLNFPFYIGQLPDLTMHEVKPADNVMMQICVFGLTILLLVIIFLFKNRIIQFRLCMFAIFIECINIFLNIHEGNKLLNGNFTIWSGLHILIMLFIILGSIGIYKDEKLVKESNRLR
ncbi:hypothetical protein BH09BAC2_BH09BAC2_21490 [soil metagenome]